MTFILSAQREGSGPENMREGFRRYVDYLTANRDRFPPSAYALATSDWFYDANDHRCPHDAWLESLSIAEPSSGCETSSVSSRFACDSLALIMTGISSSFIRAFGNLLYQLYRNGWDWNCVNWWRVAEWGFLGSGAGMLRRATATGLRRLISDPRTYKTIARNYWKARGGAAGMSLDYWMIPQAAARAGVVSRAVVNGGWNLLEMPLSWNQWLGFAPEWGGVQSALARAARIGSQVGVPGVAAGGVAAGYAIGTRAQQSNCGCR